MVPGIGLPGSFSHGQRFASRKEYVCHREVGCVLPFTFGSRHGAHSKIGRTIYGTRPFANDSAMLLDDGR